MKFAKVCTLFPVMSDAELDTLAEDIKKNGLIHPVITYRGEIIDGRNRWLACERAGVRPATVEWKGGESVVAYVLSLNLHRRQLTASQKAFVGEECLPLFEAEAAERKRAAQAKPGDKLRKGEMASALMRSPLKQEPPRKAADDAAIAVGVSTRYIQEAKEIRRERPDLVEKVKAGEITITQAKREIKEEKREKKRVENAKQIERKSDPLSGKFSTIVIDPPWDWGDEGDCDQMGRSRPDYATMSSDQLCAIKIPADDNCHIYMWITNRSMPKGFKLLDAWGFRFVTILTWPKPSFGMGNYFRGQTEHVLFGVRGSMMLKRKNASTLLPTWKRGPNGHSSKPLEFYDFVESCSHGPYLEMFSRVKRDGWRSWGE